MKTQATPTAIPNGLVPTAAMIRKLIRQGEGQDVEFKSERNGPFSSKKIIETVVCLANRERTTPGWIFLGVEDDGTVTGAHHRNGQPPQANEIEAFISNSTQPDARAQVSCVKVDGRMVVAIRVPASDMPVCTKQGLYVKRGYSGDGGTPACQPYYFSEMQGRLGSQGLFDFAEVPVRGTSMSDIDPVELQRFRRVIERYARRADTALLGLSDIDLCSAIGAIDIDGEQQNVRRLGLLLFGHDNTIRKHIPTHEVEFHQVASTQDIVSSTMHWPLVRVMEHVDELIRQMEDKADEIFIGMQRIPLPIYAPFGVREAVANALIHRDYTQMAGVQIRWLNDRFEVYNPGAFPVGVSPSNYLVTSSKTRNRSLVEAFKSAGIVERVAKGIPRMFEGQIRSGRPAPEYRFEAAGCTELIMPHGQANKQLVEMLVEESKVERNLSVEEMLILHDIFRDGQVDLSNAAASIQRSEAATIPMLDHLVSRKLLQVRGSGARGKPLWELTSPDHHQRRIGSRSPRNTSSVSTLSQQILAYIQESGTITRKDVIESFGATNWQAKAALEALADTGKIVRSGERRWTKYELPGKK